MDPCHAKRLSIMVGGLLNRVMNSFFLVQGRVLLVSSVGCSKFVATNHHISFFGFSNNSSLHTLPGPVSYGYEITTPDVWILL